MASSEHVSNSAPYDSVAASISKEAPLIEGSAVVSRQTIHADAAPEPGLTITTSAEKPPDPNSFQPEHRNAVNEDRISEMATSLEHSTTISELSEDLCDIHEPVFERPEATGKSAGPNGGASTASEPDQRNETTSMGSTIKDAPSLENPLAVSEQSDHSGNADEVVFERSIAPGKSVSPDCGASPASEPDQRQEMTSMDPTSKDSLPLGAATTGPELSSHPGDSDEVVAESPTAFGEPRDPDDIEEGKNAYRIGGFHPVYIGDVYHDRYKVLNKIGYGAYSTVWLVRDLQAGEQQDSAKRFYALKVLSAESYGTDHNTFEREVLRQMRNANQNLAGHKYICHLLDDFEVEGPNGNHVCFVFELMGETLRTFGTWFKPDDMVPETLMRKITFQLIAALDFAHESNVIHTDIKPDNIFVKVRDWSLIESGYLAIVPVPQQDKSSKDYTIVPSTPLRHFYFTEAQSRTMLECDITLGDWGVASWVDRHLTENIQPVALRAPEVLIKAPWDAKADYWNLGAVVLEVFRAVRMFDGRAASDGRYHVREHLAEMVQFFGPFPTELLGKGDQELVGALFDGDGRVKDADTLNRPDLSSEWYTTGLDEASRVKFLEFLRDLMRIDPEERPTPEQLINSPWVDAFGTHRRAAEEKAAAMQPEIG